MMIMRQAAKDIRDNLVFVAAYSIIMSIIVFILTAIFAAFSGEYNGYKILSNLVSEDRYYTEIFYKKAGGHYVENFPENMELPEYFTDETDMNMGVLNNLKELFSKEDIAGSYININSDNTDVIVLLGNYAQLMGFGMIEEGLGAFVPHGFDNVKYVEIYEEKIEILGYVTKKHQLYAPLRGNIDVSNSIIIVADLENWEDISPTIDTEQILSNLILTNPSDKQKDKLVMTTYNSGPIIIKISSITNYLKINKQILNTYMNTLIYLLTAGVVIVLGCIVNMYNLIDRKATEYFVHRIYGLKKKQLSLRILLYILMTNLLPLAVMIYVYSIYQGFSYLCIVAIFAVYVLLLSVLPLRKLFSNNKMLGLRRNY